MTQPPAIAATTTTYTTIPISAANVISRSIQNLSSTVSHHRPWPEFVTYGAFNGPDSFSSARTRLLTNFDYFRINYCIVISVCGALSLIGSPISLIVFALLLALWLLLYWFREDPLVLWGYNVSDRLVLLGLLLLSVLLAWTTGSVGTLVLGTATGLLISAVHAVFRKSEGLSTDEGAALTGSGYGTGYGAQSASVSLPDPAQFTK